MAIFFFCPISYCINRIFFLKQMDKWDQSKLEEVIEKKHGEKEKSMPKTEIVSSLLWHNLSVAISRCKYTPIIHLRYKWVHITNLIVLVKVP